MSSHTRSRFLWLIIGTALINAAGGATGRAVPMPTLTFEFEYRIPPVEIIEATLYECEDAACAVSEIPEYGGQDRCQVGRCHFAGLTADYYRLEVEFEDRVRVSHPFEKISIDATFSVAVEEDTLLVTELNSQRPGLLDGMLLIIIIVGLIVVGATIGVELIVGGVAIWLLARRGLLPILGWIAGMNLITTIVVILIAGWNQGESVLVMMIVILVEAGGLRLGGRGAGLTFPQALLVSLAMNLAGYGVRLMLLG